MDWISQIGFIYEPINNIDNMRWSLYFRGAEGLLVYIFFFVYPIFCIALSRYI